MRGRGRERGKGANTLQTTSLLLYFRQTHKTPNTYYTQTMRRDKKARDSREHSCTCTTQSHRREKHSHSGSSSSTASCMSKLSTTGSINLYDAGGQRLGGGWGPAHIQNLGDCVSNKKAKKRAGDHTARIAPAGPCEVHILQCIKRSA